jgi:phosphoglycolate phosphatase
MRYDAVLFDLDGTLLDTLEDIADAANTVLTAHGFPTHPVPSYRGFVGDGVEMLVVRMLPEGRKDRATIEACLSEYRDAYRRCWNVKTQPYAGVADMLDALTARHLKMAVLSNKPDDFTKQCVKTMLGRWRFAPVVGQLPGVPRKPDPTGAERVARKLRVPAARILYLGDSGVDMQTAVGAHMFPVGALWGFRSREELLAHGAAGLAERPGDLLAFL